MKRLLPLLLIALLLFPIASWADELDDTTNALNQKQQELQQAKQALESAKQKESELAGGLSALQASLDTAIAQVKVKEAEVAKVLAELDKQEAQLKDQKALRDIRIRALYKRLSSDKANQVVNLLDANNLVSFAKVAEYQSQVLAEEERLILELNQKVAQIDQKRASLQVELDKLAEERRLAQQKVDNLQYQINLAKNQQLGASSQIVNLNKDIQGLTQKQQEILRGKQLANTLNAIPGSETTTELPSPSFSPAYAFASFGYPHRVGLSQYGAIGRAQQGQNYKTIISAYFNNIAVQKWDIPSQVHVKGCTLTGGKYQSPTPCRDSGGAWVDETMSFEGKYMKGISEMETWWPIEAQKAQALVARTYAAKWLQNSNTICPNQDCQVYYPSKTSNPSAQTWWDAVAATSGEVVTHGGQLIATYYSITAGGITQQSGQVWNHDLPHLKIAEDCNGSWPNNCYDSISPWFHKAWGDRHGLSEGSWTCNRGGTPLCDPWITKSEMIDLLNSAMLYGLTNSASASDYSISLGGSSPEEIRQALSSRGGHPITAMSGITSTPNKAIGQTDKVIVSGTNHGTVIVAASDVYKAVNLRAPGTIALQSKLFDIITP